MSAPIFRAAGLEPSSITIRIVKDDSLNAFVAGGQNIFIHSGLIIRTEHPGQLLGVIAHETGHIAHGDLARAPSAISNATTSAIIGALLGGAVAIGTGRGDVGAVIAQGGMHAGQRSLLSFTRTQEGAADQAGARYLAAAGYSAEGLVQFLDILGDQELLSPEHQVPYARTHPITRDRIERLADQVAQSPGLSVKGTPELQEQLRRIRAKLYAFLKPPRWTFRKYPESNKSVAARYARAIALYRIPKTDEAIAALDELIAEEPRNPYFHELKGQILFEAGRGAKALAPYEKAVEYAPDSPHLRLGLARAQIEAENPALLKPAISNLRVALQEQPDDAFAWRQLAIAYGRDKQMGESALALAEEAFHRHRYTDAAGLAGRAERQLPKGSPSWLRAQDIAEAAQRLEKKKEK